MAIAAFAAARPAPRGLQALGADGDAAALQKVLDRFGRLGPDAQPVLHALPLQVELLLGLAGGVVPAQFLNDLAVARARASTAVSR